MKRGDVFWAEISPRSGSEQSGPRPVVVVSHDGFNAILSWKSIIVVPVSTSGAQARRGLTAVHIAKGAAGLTSDSVALCHQVTTLDMSKLVRFMGSLPPGDLSRVEGGLKYAMSLR